MLNGIKAALPPKLKGQLREILDRIKVPGYSSAPVRQAFVSYIVNGSGPALWSMDHIKPYGVVEQGCYLPHFLLSRAFLRLHPVSSWCDLGTGVGSLPLALMRLGLKEVIGIDGSDAALRQGLVRVPSTNYGVGDLTEPLQVCYSDGRHAHFEVVSALELLEHVPEDKIASLFDNMVRLNPVYLVLAIGLQPDPPYHVNLKSMKEWILQLEQAFPSYLYDDELSQRVFFGTKRHPRFQNDFHTNCFPENRNLVIFKRK